MHIDGIDAFEVSNNLAVNVYELGDDEGIYPLRTSTYENARDNIDLLFIEEGDQQHYVLIIDFAEAFEALRKRQPIVYTSAEAHC